MAAIGDFFREVKQEVTKVTWPSRRETVMTTAMVFFMVVFMGIVLLVVDAGIAELVQLVLNMGN